MRGNQHAPFNAAMLQVFQAIYPMATIRLWCSSDHLLALKEQGQMSRRIIHQPLRVPRLRNADKLRWVYKHLAECWALTKLLIRARRHQVSLVYFAFLSPPAQWLLSCYRVFFFKKLNILVQLHGLELLKVSRQGKFVDRVYASLLRSAFRRKRSRLYYITMEKGAQRYLQDHDLIPSSHLLCIPHPYLFKKRDMKQVQHHIPIFVHLGVARLSKGSHHFFKLAEKFKEEVVQGKAIFQVVGQVLPEMDNYLNPYVVYAGRGDMLPTADYLAALHDADYALFCYASDSYELTSSGAVMDAIAAHKPILALRNTSFSELFSLVERAPGQLFDSLEEMEQTVRSIIYQQKHFHENGAAAFVALQAHFSVDNVARELGKQLKGISC